MQVIVLGMHRSGTTLVTRLAHLFGCSFGRELEFNPATDDNPRGFYERRDVWSASEALLAAAGCTWFDCAAFAIEGVPAEARRSYEAEVRTILGRLEPERPWVVKDPRLCLLLPLWRPLLDRPVAVFAHRHPVEVARSLAGRDGFALLFGIALWERYTLAALSAAQGMPRVLVRHGDLLAEPRDAAMRFLSDLRAAAMDGLREPSAAEIAHLIEPQLHRSRRAQGEEDYLNGAQRRLLAGLDSGEALAWTEVPELSAPADDLLRRYGAERSLSRRLAEELETDHREREFLHRLTSQQHAEIDALHRSVAEAEARVEAARTEAAAARGEAADAEARTDAARAETAAAEARTAATRAESAELVGELVRRARLLDGLLDRIAASEPASRGGVLARWAPGRGPAPLIRSLNDLRQDLAGPLDALFAEAEAFVRRSRS